MMHRYAVYSEDVGRTPDRLGKMIRSFVRLESARKFASRSVAYIVRALDVPIYKPSRGPLGKAWIDLGSDMNWQDHGGKWGRPMKSDSRRWFVIQFEATADWGDTAEETYGKYYASLSIVDLDPPAAVLKGAFSFVGIDAAQEPEFANSPAVRAEALHAYGRKEVEAERNGGAAFRMVAQLAAEARGSE